VFDAATGKPRSTGTEFVLEPLAVTFSQDDKSLIAGGVDKTVSIIDTETGKVLRTLSKQPGLILSLDVTADKKQVAAIYGSADHFLTVDHLMLWDVERGTPVADFQRPGSNIIGGAFVGDHYQFAAVSDSQLIVWSIR
jgi:WD40 repeat protein